MDAFSNIPSVIQWFTVQIVVTVKLGEKKISCAELEECERFKSFADILEEHDASILRVKV